MQSRGVWAVAALLLAGTVTTAASAAEARRAPVAIEVSAPVPRADLDLAPLMQTTAESEVGKLELEVPKDARLVLSVVLIRIESTKTAEGARVSAVVAATLRDAKRGSIFAVLEGRARTETPKVMPEVERAAVRAAVQGAVHRLPDAIR
jgi:hypothetical protein